MAAVSAWSERSPVPQFNFILQPEFPLNALILASDALRIANQNSGRRFFSWCFVSETGEAVRASNGMWFGADCAIQDMPLGPPILFLPAISRPSGTRPSYSLNCGSRLVSAPSLAASTRAPSRWRKPA